MSESATRRSDSWRLRSALVTGSILITLVGLEIGARVMGAGAPEFVNLPLGQFPDNPRGYFEPCGDAFCVWTDPKQHGCPRGEAIAPPVLYLGDSFTFGQGVRVADTYSGRSTFDGYSKHNCAEPGMNVPRVVGAARQWTRAGAIRPALTIHGMTLNDLADDGVELAGFEPCPPFDVPPFNDIYDYIHFNTQDFQAWLDTREAALGPLRPLLRSRLLAFFVRRSLIADIGESTTAWYRECLSPGPRVDAALDRIRDLAAWSERHLVVLWPLMIELSDYPFEAAHSTLVKGLRERRVEVLDLLDVFRGRDASALIVHAIDRHPNEKAHALAAEAIRERLAALGWPTPTVRLTEAARDPNAARGTSAPEADGG